MKFKGVLFDFDGTLVNSMEEHYKGWRYALSYYNKDLEPKELYVLEGQGVERVARQLLDKNKIPLKFLPSVLESKRNYFEKYSNIELYPGVKEVLNWLAKHSVKVAVVTGGDKSRVIKSLTMFEIEKYFDSVITADDVKNTKPNPEPFLKAAQKLNLISEECIVVENAPLGIVSAKTAGAYCIALKTTLQENELKDADKILSNYTELLEYFKMK